MSEVRTNTNNEITALSRGGVYLIGIGGIGMSAIARYFNTQKIKVSGYDKTPTVLTGQLQEEGIEIHFEDDVSLVPKDVEMVVYTPAIPASHKGLHFYQSNQYNVVKRSDVLGIITRSSFNICVAGTHGKTTVSTMVAHILRHSGYGCNAFLGGISANYQTNFWSNERNVCVIEADEYDRSFLKLSPDIAVITAMDPDHLDIYGTADEFEKAFVAFSKKIKDNGILLVHKTLQPFFGTGQQVITYCLNNIEAEVNATNVQVKEGSYVFDVVASDWQINHLVLHMGGLHNVENVTAAIVVAKRLGIADEDIKNAVEAFKGVRRRFEYKVRNNNRVLIDDYAHHPEELKALINGVRSLYNKKMVLVFQPHLYSRTKDQAAGFADILDKCDEVILLPIYPARELPIEGVSSDMIAEKMTLTNVRVMQKEEMVEWVKNNKPELLVMAGAGDIDVLVEQVKTLLELQ